MPDPSAADPGDVLSRWVSDFNAKDLGGICRLYAPGAVLWGTFSSSLITSADGIRDYFARAFAPSLQASAELGDVERQVFGTMVVASGTYRLHAVIDGHPRVLPARFTFVLSGSGSSWSIVNHHSSLTPSPA